MICCGFYLIYYMSLEHLNASSLSSNFVQNFFKHFSP
eukprot:UN07006